MSNSLLPGMFIGAAISALIGTFACSLCVDTIRNQAIEARAGYWCCDTVTAERKFVWTTQPRRLEKQP